MTCTRAGYQVYHCDIACFLCVCPAAQRRASQVHACAFAAHRCCAQEQIGFDALLLCDDADLKELGLRKGVRVKILGAMRGWAAEELARLS